MSITPRGVIFLGGATGMIIAGLFLIDGPLISLGVAGGLVALLAWGLGRWNLSGLGIHLHAPSRVFAGTAFDLRVTQENRKVLLATCALKVTIRLGGATPVTAETRWTGTQTTSTVRLRGSLPQRGSHSRHPGTIQSTFPFGLFSFRRKIMIEHEMLVFPQSLVPREFFSSGEFDDAWEGGGLRAGDLNGEPRGLRPYQPGDRAKQMHWPATLRALARGRNPRVREYDPPGFRPSEAVLLFHSYGTDHTLIRTDLFERALSLVCGSLRHLRAIEVPTTLLADFLSWQPRPTYLKEAWGRTLTELAGAIRADHTEAHDVMAEIEALPADKALVIISDMPLRTWQHLLKGRPAILIDIHQHKAAHKNLNLGTSVPALPPRAL